MILLILFFINSLQCMKKEIPTHTISVLAKDDSGSSFNAFVNLCNKNSETLGMWTKQQLLKLHELNTSTLHLVIDEKTKNVCGGSILVNYGDYFSLAIITIDNIHRGKGLGSSLIETIEKYVNDNTIKDYERRIELEVFKKNKEAIKFYEKLKFIAEKNSDGTDKEISGPEGSLYTFSKSWK